MHEDVCGVALWRHTDVSILVYGSNRRGSIGNEDSFSRRSSGGSRRSSLEGGANAWEEQERLLHSQRDALLTKVRVLRGEKDALSASLAGMRNECASVSATLSEVRCERDALLKVRRGRACVGARRMFDRLPCRVVGRGPLTPARCVGQRRSAR